MILQRILILTLLLLPALPAAGVLPPDGPQEPLPDFDIRGRERMSAESLPTPAQAAALRLLSPKTTGTALAAPRDDLVVRWGPQPGTLHHIFRRDGFLWTPPAGRAPDPEAAAIRYISGHGALLGLSEQDVRQLHLARRMQDPGSGALHLLYEQRVEGIEVFLGQVRVNLDRHGRIVSMGGDTAPAAIRSRELVLDEDAALVAAARSVRVALEEAPALSRRDARGRAHFEQGPFESAPWVDATWFPFDDGLVRAWRVIVDPALDQGWYQVVVDASTGEVLHRHDLVANVATAGLAFREDPGQGPQEMLPFVDDTVLTDPASPLGWSTIGETEGNNVEVKDDRAGDNEATIGVTAAGTGPDPLLFDFPFTDNPTDDLDASLTNLFWLNNWLHDRLWRMGFDEAAGNFQIDNFGRGGRGGDRLRVDAQDGAGMNNANMGTPPDGSNPRMQMFLWNRTNPNRDSGFDGSVVVHEFFHGVSNRLVGGGDNAGCLGTAHGGAMGEGWSDFFPCSFWDMPTVGGYLVNNYVRGIRRAAYDVHPYDYGDLCNQGAFEVHRDGEIWAATLWDIRRLFIQKYGFQEGRCKVERLVLDGMKLSPCRPDFLDMRDAILMAGALHGFDGDVCLLWEGFAGRGMGVDAAHADRCTAGQDVTSYDVPPECADCDLPRPGNLSVDTSLPNEVVVRFTPAPGADRHVLLRSSAPCPGRCLEAEFVEVASGPGDASELRDADADGNRLSAGRTFSYRVMAAQGDACTAFSDCSEATVTGRCTERPEGAADPAALGVTRLQRPPSPSCTIEVSWAEAEALCGDPSAVRYNIYRHQDPAFIPGPENLLVSVAAPLTSWTDAATPPAEVTYVVRAEDLTTGGDGPHGGNEEANDVRLTLAPQGLPSGAADFADDVEAGELPGYRRTGVFEPNDWQVVSDGNTRGGSAWHVTGQEGGTADKNLHLPLLSLGPAPRMTFAHTFDFENRFDGGVVEISTDGGLTWRDLLDDFTAGGYDTSAGSGTSQTVGPLINPPNTNQVWTGENAAGFGAYDAVEVDLAPYADTLDAQLRFRCLLDPLIADPGGWYVDDILVEDILAFEACTDGCTDPPRAVLPDVSVCGMPGEPIEVHLDGSGSVPGSAGLSAELAWIFTHEGPGAFDGRRWADGPTATLTFPPGTPPGDYQVTLTVRGEDTCADRRTAIITLEEGAPPVRPVGETLRVGRFGEYLALTWAEVGAPGYNAHAVEMGARPTAMHQSVPVASAPNGLILLDTGPAVPGAGSFFLQVFATTSCGNSWPWP